MELVGDVNVIRSVGAGMPQGRRVEFNGVFGVDFVRLPPLPTPYPEGNLLRLCWMKET